MKFVAHENLLLLLFTAGLCAIYVYCEFAFEKRCPCEYISPSFFHTFPKKATIRRQTAFESRWKSSNAKPSEISSSGNVPQLRRRTGAGDTKSEMRTFQGEGGDFLHSTVGLIDVHKLFRSPQHQLQAKPTGLLQDLCFISFFLNTSKENIYMPTNMRQSVCLCFFPPM